MNKLDDIRDELLGLMAGADVPLLREIETVLHELADIACDNLSVMAGNGGDY